jgi:hypothetical protein
VVVNSCWGVPQKKKEDEQLSLDEYLQQKKDAQAGIAALEARPVDAFDMKGLKPVLKEDEVLIFRHAYTFPIHPTFCERAHVYHP